MFIAFLALLQLLTPTGDDRGNAQGDSGRLSLRLAKHGKLWVSYLSSTWRFHGLLMLLRELVDGRQLSSVCCFVCRSTAFGCFWYFYVCLVRWFMLVHCLYLFLCQPFCGLQRHSWIGRVQSSCCKVCIGIFGWKMRQLAHKQHPQAIITRLQLWAASQCSMKANCMGMKWDEAMKPTWAHGRET